MTIRRAIAFFLLGSLSLTAQDSVDVHRLSLGKAKYRYDLRIVKRGEILAQDSDKKISFPALVKELAGYRVILLGESHDNLAHHKLQAKVIGALAKAGRPLVVGMEFFQPKDNGFLADYVAGKRELVDTFAATNWATNGGFNYRFFQPILETAKASGATIVGLNVPRTVVRAVSRGGLAGLSPAQRRLFPPVDVTNREHRYLIRNIFGRMAVTNFTFFENFYAAQSVWDTVMASRSLTALDQAGPRSQVVVIVGGGHVYYDLGIAARIKALRPEVKVASLVMLSVPEKSAGRSVMQQMMARRKAPQKGKGKAKGKMTMPPVKKMGKPKGKMPTNIPGKMPPAMKAKMSGKMPGKLKPSAKGKKPPHGMISMGKSSGGVIISRTLGRFIAGLSTKPQGGQFPKLSLKLTLKEKVLQVSSLSKTGVLAKAGLKKGDRIELIDGVKFTDKGRVMLHLMQKNWGDQVVIQAGRGQESIKVQARLKKKKAAPKMKMPGGMMRPAAKSPAKQKHLHHKLEVTLDPLKNQIRWTDRITMPVGVLRPKETSEFSMRLSPVMKFPLPSWSSGGKISGTPEDPAIPRWYLKEGKPEKSGHWLLGCSADHEITLTAEGNYSQAPQLTGKDHARGFSTTRGIIAEKGVFLSGGSRWLPQIAGFSLFTFDLTIKVPANWEVISQGRLVKSETVGEFKQITYSCDRPQEEIYLVGGPLHKFTGPPGKVATSIYLAKKDPALAGRYLGATKRYLDMYAEMLGAYPYCKFATVENFWETGYGMPSFTLLGPRVIRFPWILVSSFPHEILHNWWGNGVYVDNEQGNWCEGITAYLADHLLKEHQGLGADYRVTSLAKYTNFAAGTEKDFPLTRFKSRQSPATEAIGYGKALMVYHMLRRSCGDKAFLSAMRSFYRQNKYRPATWRDIRNSFEVASGKDLSAFFAQWLERSGAPQLVGTSAACRKIEDCPGYFELACQVEQRQTGPPYQLDVPYLVHFGGKTPPVPGIFALSGKKGGFKRVFKGRPLRVDLDPGFDIFRRLLPGETAPSLSKVLGAQKTFFVLPAAAPAAELAAYRVIGQRLAAGRGDEVQVILDTDQAITDKSLSDTALWICGWSNRLRSRVEEGIKACGGQVQAGSFTLGDGKSRGLQEGSVVAALPHPSPRLVTGFISLCTPAAGAALSRKLAHYGKYGYLVFDGEGAANSAKGRWHLENSPLFLPVLGPQGEKPSAIKSAPRKEKPLWPAPAGGRPRRHGR